MSSPIEPVTSFLSDAGSKAGDAAGGIAGKLIGSLAGLLVIITILRHTFYVVRVGHRGVVHRKGVPVRRRVPRLLRTTKNGPIYLAWFGPRTGSYIVKRPGVWVKIPGWHDVEKVNIQERTQHLALFDADCSDGLREIRADLVTRVLCDDDGSQYAEHPVRVVQKSSEPDEMFESDAGTALREVLESEECTPERRRDKDYLLTEVNKIAGEHLEALSYTLMRVNLRSCARKSIQVAVDSFATPDPSNVVKLPHQFVMVEALRDAATS